MGKVDRLFYQLWALQKLESGFFLLFEYFSVVKFKLRYKSFRHTSVLKCQKQICRAQAICNLELGDRMSVIFPSSANEIHQTDVDLMAEANVL